MFASLDICQDGDSRFYWLLLIRHWSLLRHADLPVTIWLKILSIALDCRSGLVLPDGLSDI